MADEALFLIVEEEACWFLRCRIEYLGRHKALGTSTAGVRVRGTVLGLGRFGWYYYMVRNHLLRRFQSCNCFIFIMIFLVGLFGIT